MTPSMWTSCLHPLEPEEAVRCLAELGWRTIEFSDEHWRALDARDDPEQHFHAMRGLFADLGLDVPQMHGPMFNVCDQPDDLRPNMKLAQRALRWAGVMGIGCFVFHTGSVPWGDDEQTLDRVRQRNADTIGALAECGREVGVKIAVENTADEFTGRRYFGALPSELLWVVRNTDPDWVGICWDTGHAHMQGLDQARCLETIGECLIATHIQDNDAITDQHLLPFEGTIDWKNLMHGLRSIEYEGAFNFEVSGAMGRVPLPVRPAKLRYALELAEALVAGTVPE